MEPLIPLLRRARRDTRFPAAVSLLAIRRAWSVSGGAGVLVPSAVPWAAALGTVLVLARGPDPEGALACALVLGWSCLVPGGPGRGWSGGPGVVGPGRCGVRVGAEHVG